jgi:DNA-binding response OmpR family regulator
MQHVLIIEDEKDIAEILKAKFNQANRLIECQENGDDGLASILNNCPQVIILDLILPKKSGYDILGEISKLVNRAQIKVITTTGSVPTREQKEFILKSTDHFLEKPFCLQELNTLIEAPLN